MRKWLLLSFLCCSLPAFAQKDSSLALTHVTVIDCTGALAQPNSTVVVSQGHITAVGLTDAIRIPAGARVVDATGKFLIPGLWDMHGHLTDAKTLSLCSL
jgi:imidazolonepropionase-like amidohydrolase